MLRNKIKRKKQTKKRIKKTIKRMSIISDIKTKQNQMKNDEIEKKNNLKRIQNKKRPIKRKMIVVERQNK
jgi:hypothetical protein